MEKYIEKQVQERYFEVGEKEDYFSPFPPWIPVPGLTGGTALALVVCFVPRILVGVTPWLVYTLLQALSRRRGSVLQAGSMALSAWWAPLPTPPW